MLEGIDAMQDFPDVKLSDSDRRIIGAAKAFCKRQSGYPALLEDLAREQKFFVKLTLPNGDELELNFLRICLYSANYDSLRTVALTLMLLFNVELLLLGDG